jgi:hypothetical protein
MNEKPCDVWDCERQARNCGRCVDHCVDLSAHTHEWVNGKVPAEPAKEEG